MQLVNVRAFCLYQCCWCTCKSMDVATTKKNNTRALAQDSSDSFSPLFLPQRLIDGREMKKKKLARARREKREQRRKKKSVKKIIEATRGTG